MTRFDEELRSRLRAGTPHVDVAAFLADVHRGARRRRQRRAVTVAAVAVLAVTGAASALLPGSGLQSAPPVAGTGTPSPTTSPSPTRPSESPSQSPTGSPTELPTEVPTDSAGNPLETGVFGFDAHGGLPWRVTSEGCGGATLCSRVSSYDGDGGWTTLADLAWEHPKPGEVQPPAEHVTVAPDGQEAWAYGSDVWSTHDAGRTWAAQHLPLHDTGVAEIAVVAGEAVLRTNRGSLLRSSVGGDDWSTLALPAGMSYAEQVLAVGDTLLVRGRDVHFTMKVVTSDDGGDHWTAATAPCNPEQPAYTLVNGSLFAICGTSPTGAADVMRSDDRAATWTKLLGMQPRADDYVELVLPVDKHSVYVVGSFGGLLQFPEGEKQYGDALHLSRDAEVFGGTFVSPEHGYLMVGPDRKLLETTDGGQHWDAIG